MINYANMENKVVLVTGATDGIGKQVALDLASLGAHVFIHGRNAEKAEKVRQEIIQKTGNPRVDVLIADFQSLKQVRKMAADLHQQTRRLDVLINNAGIFMNKRRLSTDGYEMTFAVNHLAPFLLTNLLLDLLHNAEPARIITVSSSGHKLVYLNPLNLQGKSFYWGWVAYCRSKLLNMLFTLELSELLKGTSVVTNAVHPGVVKTRLLKSAGVSSSLSVAEGAQPIVRLASAPEFGNVSGKYFSRMKQSSPNQIATRGSLRRKIWELSAGLVGLPFFITT